MQARVVNENAPACGRGVRIASGQDDQCENEDVPSPPSNATA